MAVDARRGGGDVGGFWAEIFALPTVVYTTLLVIASLYWLSVVIGGLEIDVLDVDADVDVDVGDTADGEGAGGFLGLLSALGLRGVPLTFSLSVLTLWSWALCFLGMHHLAPLAAGVLPAWLAALGVALGSFVVAIFGTNLSIRPFQRVFKTHHAPSKLAFIGRPCTITTATVDARFGQALCEDGGAGLVIAVRYEGPATLVKGQKAVLADYDPKRDVFIVEPLDLPDDGEQDRDAEPERRDRGPREPAS